jgi:GNAT superfamily N-acetyltransferase
MRIVISNQLPCKLYKEFEVLPGILWFLVYNKNKLCGYGGIQLNFYNRAIYLGPTYIFKKHRGKGLQSKLLKVRERWAKKYGFTTLTTCAYPDNKYSIANILKAGFQEATRIVRGDKTEIWYEKKI